jgi:HAE1 family hydrophobic/amphiphilic exporter-1
MQNGRKTQGRPLLSHAEIGGLSFAITLVMSAVFIQLAFYQDNQLTSTVCFSVTMAISLLFQGINTLTLAPRFACCHYMLEEDHI